MRDDRRDAWTTSTVHTVSPPSSFMHLSPILHPFAQESRYRVGEKVDALYDSKWYPAVVHSISMQGRCNVIYLPTLEHQSGVEDSDTEELVDAYDVGDECAQYSWERTAERG